MKTFSFEELSEAAKENVVNLYYADSDYQAFIEEVQKENADDMPTVEDWAIEKSIRFNEEGERVYQYYKCVTDPLNNADDYMVKLGENECYSPLSGHGVFGSTYLKDCVEISKQEYLDGTKGKTTPPEYL